MFDQVLMEYDICAEVLGLRHIRTTWPKSCREVCPRCLGKPSFEFVVAGTSGSSDTIATPALSVKEFD